MSDTSVTEILLVEDNAADRDLTRDLLSRSPFAHRIHHVADGAEALNFLRRKGKFSAMPMPHLVLLDLNLPLKNGREVLAEVKSDPTLCEIPVIIFSTSHAPQDIRGAYELGANSYVCKPCNLGEFVVAVSSISEFWSNNARAAGKENA